MLCITLCGTPCTIKNALLLYKSSTFLSDNFTYSTLLEVVVLLDFKLYISVSPSAAAHNCLHSFLPPTNEVCEGYVFTGVCLSTGGGGGMHGCSQGGHAWLLPGGACMVAPRGACVVAQGGMHGCSGGSCMVAPGGHAWLLWGACVVAPGGHAWFFRWDTVNERAVRILLECILVLITNSWLWITEFWLIEIPAEADQILNRTELFETSGITELIGD